MLGNLNIFSPSDPDWDTWVKRAPHDVFHTAAYHRFEGNQERADAQLLVYGDENRFLIFPYLQRDVGSGFRDATSVYGYTGPVGRGLTPDFVAEAWEAFRVVWRDRRIVTVFTRFHPMLENAGIALSMTGDQAPFAGAVIHHLGRSVSIDLSLGIDERRMSYPQPLRQEIKKAERNGLVVEDDPDWAYFSGFMELYRVTMSQNSAADRYLFSDAYFSRLKDAMAGYAFLSVARVNGQLAAAMIYTVCGEHASAHLTGIDPAFRAYSPLKPLIDCTADLAFEKGATRFHLGAGRGGHEDSLFEFKSRFSKDHHDFKVGRWVLDAKAYESLTAEAHGDMVPDPSFFPAYRAPRAAVEAIG